jgi:glutathione S-transferase
MITIHAIIGSPFGRAAALTCLEKGAPYRIAPVIPGEHRQPAYLARHPFGRIPAIDDDGFGLYETQAILRYIDAAYPGASLQPTDAKSAARMNQVMGIIDWYFFSPTGAVPLVFNRIVAPKIGLPVNEEAALAAVAPARQIVEVLSGFLADGRPYFAGDGLSLAELHAGPHLDFLSQCDEGAEMLAGTPLVPWLARLNARPSFVATTWDTLAAAA